MLFRHIKKRDFYDPCLVFLNEKTMMFYQQHPIFHLLVVLLLLLYQRHTTLDQYMIQWLHHHQHHPLYILLQLLILQLQQIKLGLLPTITIHIIPHHPFNIEKQCKFNIIIIIIIIIIYPIFSFPHLVFFFIFCVHFFLSFFPISWKLCFSFCLSLSFFFHATKTVIQPIHHHFFFLVMTSIINTINIFLKKNCFIIFCCFYYEKRQFGRVY